MLVRAFDKAVRRKPLAFAADAVGLWALHVGEGGSAAAGGVVRESNDTVLGRGCGVVALIMRGAKLGMFR